MIKNIPLKISNQLKYYPLLHDFLREIYCIFFPGIRATIAKAFKNYKKITVVKIGAMDGICADPLSSFLLNDPRVGGVLVEPMQQYVDELERNFGATGRYNIQQVAISDYNGFKKFYYLDTNQIPIEYTNHVPWYIGGLSSLSKEHLEKNTSKDLHRWINAIEISVLTFQTLLQRCNLEKVDLLLIDTEGHDYIILKTINFSNVKPKVVVFEKKHLALEEFNNARILMENNGYQVSEKEDDYICILK